MKKITFYTLWAFLCLHTTISFSEAASGPLDASLSEIDMIIANTESGITLDSAPTLIYQRALAPVAQTEFTSWELTHRTAMLQGFMWGGETANFITPSMYIGTPLETNANILGYSVDIGATNYIECVRSETEASFGPNGTLIEGTTEDELRNMAKYCATEFYGSYFTGKSYTTREEMLMFIFTMFDEGVELPGYFDSDVFVFDGEETESTYTNVSTQAWFAPYILRAKEIGMVPPHREWATAQTVSNTDINSFFDEYSQYRITNDGNITTGGRLIQSSHGSYVIDRDAGKLMVKKIR
jgi:hypothetical protein